MDAWSTFWGCLLVVVLVIFTVLAVAVTIGGFFDIKALLKTIKEENHEEE